MHHTNCLKFSALVSAEGASMYRFCRDNGSKQWVTKPMCENHLLDMVVTDFIEVSKVLVLLQIADHNFARAAFKVNVPVLKPQ